MNLSAAAAIIAFSAASPAAVFASSKTGKHMKPKTSKTSTKAAKQAKSFVKPSLSYSGGGSGGSYSMSVGTATPTLKPTPLLGSNICTWALDYECWPSTGRPSCCAEDSTTTCPSSSDFVKDENPPCDNADPA